MSLTDEAPARSYVRKVKKREENKEEEKPEEEGTTVKMKIAGDSGWTAEDKIPEPEEKITVDESTEEFVTTLQDEDDITQQVAHAPELVQQKLQGIKELSTQREQILPANIDTRGFNLSVLASSLYPWELVFEKDAVWDHSQLLKKLSTELEKSDNGLLNLDEDSYIIFKCNMCMKEIPATDVRFHCTACDDYDMCSPCFAEGRGHTYKHEHDIQVFPKSGTLSVWGFL